MKIKDKPVCYLFVHDKKHKIKRWFAEMSSDPKLAGSLFGKVCVCGTDEEILVANEKALKKYHPKREH